MFSFLQGYKTYLVVLGAFAYAGIGVWAGFMNVEAASAVIIGALGFAGLKSGQNSQLVQILSALGIDVPKNAGMNQIKQAVAAYKKTLPTLLAVFLVGSMTMSCAYFPAKQDPQTVLNEVSAGFGLAEAAYAGICALPSAPQVICGDPVAYAKAKEAVEAAIRTAQAAINASQNTDSAAIEELLSELQRDWQTYNGIVNTAQAKNAQAKGTTYQAIPL